MGKNTSKYCVIACTLLAQVFNPAVAQAPAQYTNKELRFTVSYPQSYRITDVPCAVARHDATFGYQLLLYLEASSAADAATLSVTLDRRSLSLKTLEELHARSGESPQVMTIGDNVFYYYGRGGGGVRYPDEFFYNLDGQILGFTFDGPYAANGSTPSTETKEMERSFLKSFRRTFSNSSH